MAAPNAFSRAFPEAPAAVSKRSLCVAGILVTVYGLDELREGNEEVACLWLLHPRLADQSSMEPLAFSAINSWNSYLKTALKTSTLPGLIAVTFDQRNHGSRKIDDLANQDWKSGNERHAQDMFAGYHGTALDASHLLTYISSYIFPRAEHSLVDNFVCGVSLGGHAAWQVLMDDPRISTAIIIIGCPDYITLMQGRALQSNLETAGPKFLGSKDFPEQLLEAVGNHDPAGQLIGIDSTRTDRFNREPISNERATISAIMHKAFRNKRILNMSGGDDLLVPYSSSEPFLQWLQRAIAPGGPFNDTNLEIEDTVFDGVGHAVSPEMVQKLNRYLVNKLRTIIGKDNKDHKL